MRPDGNTARAAAVRAVVLLVVAVLVGSLVVSPAAAQEDGGTDTTVEPAPDATTPAPAPDSPDPAETTTTLADLETPEGPVREAPLTESERASRTIDWVVAGLLLLALVVAVATVVFWRRTRPSRLLAEEMADTAQQRGPEPAAPQPPMGPTGPTTDVATPPKPLPTAPGSWDAFAAEVGLDASQTPTAPSAEQPSVAQQPSLMQQPRVEPEVSEARQAAVEHGVTQPPRPAFETAPTGSWASQGWGDRGGDTAPVPPQRSGDPDSPKGSWRWNERAGHAQDAAGPAAPQADSAQGEPHGVEGGRAENGRVGNGRAEGDGEDGGEM